MSQGSSQRSEYRRRGERRRRRNERSILEGFVNRELRVNLDRQNLVGGRDRAGASLPASNIPGNIRDLVVRIEPLRDEGNRVLTPLVADVANVVAAPAVGRNFLDRELRVNLNRQNFDAIVGAISDDSSPDEERNRVGALPVIRDLVVRIRPIDENRVAPSPPPTPVADAANAVDADDVDVDVVVVADVRPPVAPDVVAPDVVAPAGAAAEGNDGGDDGDDGDDDHGDNDNDGGDRVRPPVRGGVGGGVRDIRRPIARRVTFGIGIATPTDNLERLCDAPYLCGPFTDTCRRCGAKFFAREPKNRAGIRLSCCGNGNVVLPPLRCPPEFRRLFTGNDHRTVEFLNAVRAVNSTFAMASFKTSAPNREIEGQGRWSFSVRGQIYHFTMGVPASQDLREPRLNHFYFLDVDQVMDRRREMLDGRVGLETQRLVETVLRRVNPYVGAYRTIGEVLREDAERQRGNRGDDDAVGGVADVIIGFRRRGDINVQNRRYDLPESRSEIAALFYGEEPPYDLDLKLYPRDAAPDNVPAAVFAGEDPRERRRRRRHHELKNLNPLADPMVYPLLFPHGETGYETNMRNGNHAITMREFYRYRIQSRDAFSLLHNGGKLFQQYLIDAWVRVEANQLWWYRQHQDRFRHAAEEAVRRVIAANPGDAPRVGRAVVLPSAFYGGPRNMQRVYLDAMTVVARHGKPDLFITFTCNPNWPEIKDNLEFRQKPENRPDLLCRVFHQKLLEFMDDLVQKQVWGRVLNYHYSIEFQKRGLPHAHIVVTFYRDDKLDTVEKVDDVICAIIPDRRTRPRLYDLVGRYQVHRPCGRLNENASCMVEGRCKKFFPKPYRDETVLAARRSGRAEYRRPRDGRSYTDDGDDNVRITNSRIVPYNPYATAKYQTHINFELVGSLEMVKYMYKYVTKGPDSAIIVGGEEGAVDGGEGGEGGDNGGEGVAVAGGERRRREIVIDEVNNYLDCRYVSAMEAAWRLLEFKLHDRSHSVMVLPVHLPGERQIVYERDDDDEDLEGRLMRPSKLEAWFALNANDAAARVVRYREIPERYTWVGTRGEWSPRRQVSKMVGCIAEVTAREGGLELFYLRVLLKYVAGATSYEDLRTYGGRTFDTFKDACVARGLLIEGNEYDECMAEAGIAKFPNQLRRLFALILTVMDENQLVRAAAIFRSHKVNMIRDYLLRGMSRVEAVESCIRDIDAILRRCKPTLRCVDLGITVGDDDREEDDRRMEVDDGGEEVGGGGGGEIDEDEEIAAGRVYDPTDLNGDQRRIFVRVVRAVCRSAGRGVPREVEGLLGGEVDERGDEEEEEVVGDRRLFYVDGPGGTGKTFLYNTLIYYVVNVLRLKTASVAWTGIAANLLIGGKTAHRCFRLQINLSADSVVGWTLESRDSETLREVALVLWDEAPMSHRYAVEAVDRYFRELMDARFTPMGGKCVVFGGDFRQVLPVISRGDLTAVINASLKMSYVWRDMLFVRLETNMRAAAGAPRIAELGDRDYAEWLLALGEDRLPHVAMPRYRFVPEDLVEIPKMFHCDGVERLLDFVYDEGYVGEGVGDRAVLCPTNAAVNEINQRILEIVGGESRTYVSVDSLKSDGEDDGFVVRQDVLNSLNIPSLPPHELTLKVGAVVILMRNLDVDRGECNGTRLRVVDLGEHFVECAFLTGERRGRRVILPRVLMTGRDNMLPRDVLRMQFPIRLAYAMTINKSQGQTFGRVGVYLEDPCFGHGQLYVAFSRVGAPENVRIYIESGEKQGSFRHRGGKRFTRNVVYDRVLGDPNVVEGVGEVGRGRRRVRELIAADEFYDGADEPVPEDRFVDAWLGDEDENEWLGGLYVDEENNVVREVAGVDPYVGVDGADRPLEYAPVRNTPELLARVSTMDRPGTSGAGVNVGRVRPLTPSPSDSD